MRMTLATCQRCTTPVNIPDGRELFVSLGLQNLATTVKTRWADVVTQVLLTRVGFNSGGRIDQKVV